MERLEALKPYGMIAAISLALCFGALVIAF